MRLRTRLVLTIAVAALVPVGLLGAASVRIATDRVEARVIDLQARTADGLAIYVDTWLEARLQLLEQQVQAFPVGRLDDRSTTSYLSIVYRQTPEAAIVTLTDLEGTTVAPPVFLAPGVDGGGDPILASRDRVPAERFAAYRRALPLARLRAMVQGNPEGIVSQPIVGLPVLPPGRGVPVLAVATPVPGSPLVLGVELDLGPLARRFGEIGSADLDAALLDQDGRLVLGGQSGLIDPDVFRPPLGSIAADAIAYEAADGRQVLASSSPVPRVGWTVVIAEPAEISAATTDEIRNRTGFVGAIAALLSLVLGVLFSRELSGPIVALKDAALSVAEGDLGRRVPPEGAGEVAELTRAFNFMSTRLRRNAEEIDRKNAEIEAFNRDLQRRVDDRTRELREAQDRLVQSARLAAVGEMGAGLAHELNNPVAGILGLVQVLRRKRATEPDDALLRSVEKEAMRCKEILGQLQGFSQGDATSLDAPTEELGPLDLDQVVAEVLRLVSGTLRQRGLVVQHRPGGELLVSGDRAGLGRALAQVLLSLRAAARSGGTLTITGRRGPDAVVLELSLHAERIDVGGDDWMASGMGFWAARQVLAGHGGRLLDPEEPPGGGVATWRVELPPA